MCQDPSWRWSSIGAECPATLEHREKIRSSLQGECPIAGRTLQCPHEGQSQRPPSVTRVTLTMCCQSQIADVILCHPKAHSQFLRELTASGDSEILLAAHYTSRIGHDAHFVLSSGCRRPRDEHVSGLRRRRGSPHDSVQHATAMPVTHACIPRRTMFKVWHSGTTIPIRM